VFRTNKNAPNYKLIAIDLLDYGEDKWVDLLPEHLDNVLDWATAVDEDKFVACYIQDVKVKAQKYTKGFASEFYNHERALMGFAFHRTSCNCIA